MLAGVTVEIRCPRGSVSFQAQVPLLEESVRFVQKELKPGESWTWNLGLLPAAKVGAFAVQSMYAAVLTVGADTIELEGQQTTDFGVLFARRGEEVIGSLPGGGDITALTVVNRSNKVNRIDVLVAESRPFGPQERTVVTELAPPPELQLEKTPA